MVPWNTLKRGSTVVVKKVCGVKKVINFYRNSLVDYLMNWKTENKLMVLCIDWERDSGKIMNIQLFICEQTSASDPFSTFPTFVFHQDPRSEHEIIIAFTSSCFGWIWSPNCIKGIIWILSFICSPITTINPASTTTPDRWRHVLSECQWGMLNITDRNAAS